MSNIIEYVPPELWCYILESDVNINTNFVKILIFMSKNKKYNVNIHLVKSSYFEKIIFGVFSNKKIYLVYKNIDSIKTLQQYSNYYLMIYDCFSRGNVDKYYNTLIKNYIFIMFLRKKIENTKDKKKFYNIVKIIFKHSIDNFNKSDFRKKEIVFFRNKLNYFDSIFT